MVASENQLCWRHQTDVEHHNQGGGDSVKTIRWEDSLRPLSPDTVRRRSVKRSHSDRRPRPFSNSPDRKFSTTIASRLKQKADIKYEARPVRTRRVSCPPTSRPPPAQPVARPRPPAVPAPPQSVLKKRSSSAPRVRLSTPSPPSPSSRSPGPPPGPPREPPVDYHEARRTVSSSSSGNSGSNRSKKKKMRRSRRESMSSYSSSNTVTKVYPGCLAM